MKINSYHQHSFSQEQEISGMVGVLGESKEVARSEVEAVLHHHKRESHCKAMMELNIKKKGQVETRQHYSL